MTTQNKHCLCISRSFSAFLFSWGEILFQYLFKQGFLQHCVVQRHSVGGALCKCLQKQVGTRVSHPTTIHLN
jgi:hypothetical protein